MAPVAVVGSGPEVSEGRRERLPSGVYTESPRALFLGK